jgi:hypothetical protein
MAHGSQSAHDRYRSTAPHRLMLVAQLPSNGLLQRLGMHLRVLQLGSLRLNLVR